MNKDNIKAGIFAAILVAIGAFFGHLGGVVLNQPATETLIMDEDGRIVSRTDGAMDRAASLPDDGDCYWFWDLGDLQRSGGRRPMLYRCSRWRGAMGWQAVAVWTQCGDYPSISHGGLCWRPGAAW